MAKLAELRIALKIIKRTYKDCQKTLSSLKQNQIRFDNDIADLKKEIQEAENYLKLKSSKEKMFSLLVYKPKVKIKKKGQTVIKESDYLNYLPFENEILVRNKRECREFIDLAKKELIIWEEAGSVFKKRCDLAFNDLKKISTKKFQLEQKIEKKLSSVLKSPHNKLKENKDEEVFKKIKMTERLMLSPNEKEILNSKIVDEVNNFIDSGKGSQAKAFKELSKDSIQIFSYSLSPKAIEGRYSRNKGTNRRTNYR